MSPKNSEVLSEKKISNFYHCINSINYNFNSDLNKLISKKITKKNHFLVNLLRLQENIKINIKNNFKINLEEKIKSFFDFIDNKIDQYKSLIKEEKQRLKIEAYEKEQKIKQQEKQEELETADLQLKLQQKQLREEILLEKQRSKDLKNFLRLRIFLHLL